MFSGGKNKSILLMLIIPVLLVFLNVGLAAQETEEEANNSQNSLVKGSKSFQFRISPDFTLSAFNGGMISAKKHFSQNSALRFGIGLEARVSKNNYITSERKTTDFDIDLTVQYLYYPAPQSAVNFYFGSGPIVQYQRHKENIKNADGIETGYNYNRAWSLGMLGSWGVEWFADDNISFICEYGAGISYSSSFLEDQSNTSKRHEILFFSQGVDFGLSVYF